ncbi:E3 ubiquitin-protein ligase NRDP1-like [Dendronephthya gigantea]|uniref:E3 ubiquitin-protein ligase NRDP1-like n=1 Tax=Dendronephthya gigantea TaxID=151771 RepID=UPI0010691743|nr:E3 ubiquitin-protein ligase NRDP1-like [Dendronephthya gigantea]
MVEGYSERRFQETVRAELMCNICFGVLRNPRLCEAEEHQFCLGCITRCLAESNNCPVCQTRLTVATLKPLGRFWLRAWSELRINCEYYNQGCPEQIPLGSLHVHVDCCPFRPCEKCGAQTIDEDGSNVHDQDICEFGTTVRENFRDVKIIEEKLEDEFASHNRKGRKFDEKIEELEKKLESTPLMKLA